jgi:hypothetical protein
VSVKIIRRHYEVDNFSIDLNAKPRSDESNRAGSLGAHAQAFIVPALRFRRAQ